MRLHYRLYYTVGLLVGMLSPLATPAYAASIAPESLPGASDAGRIRPQDQLDKRRETPPMKRVRTDRVVPPIAIPPGAENIHFKLNSVAIEGMTEFTQQDFFELYAPLMQRRVSMKQVYELAGKITLRYRNAGYMLSYAYVPDQKIEHGGVVIRVAEGYVGRVSVEGHDPNEEITQKYITRITDERPLNEKTLESVLLRLNDLPGRSYRAILSRDKNQPPGEVLISLVPQKKKAQASVGFDNFSSRYLGPNEVNASYSDSFLPRQQTTVLGLSSLPLDKLNYGLVKHSYVLAPDITVDGTVSYTRSQPGYRLKSLDIDSKSSDFIGGINYQWIRQRDHNLLLKLQMESRHVESDLTGNTPLTRDNVRTIHGSVSYDMKDRWGGTNVADLEVTQGLAALGASKKGAANLSRSQAKPDFTKMELTLSHIQALAENWSVQLQASGQMASGPLYASEEFGVGGQTYGRAYDNSEIVGDNGAAGMVEVRYAGYRTLQPVNLEPYLYFDSGIVTNRDVGQSKRDSLSSVGFGVRFATNKGQSGLLGISVPLNRQVNAPIYGRGKSSPRLMLQVSQSF